MTVSSLEKRQLIDRLCRDVARITGRRYAVDYEALNAESLRELVRLVQDLEHDRKAAVNQARMMPWRR